MFIQFAQLAFLLFFLTQFTPCWWCHALNIHLNVMWHWLFQVGTPHISLINLWHLQSPGTSYCNNRISISPSPAGEKMAWPCAWHCLGGKKRRCEWLIPVTCISVVLVAGLLMAVWVHGCLVPLLTASPSCFLPPCRIVFQGPVG